MRAGRVWHLRASDAFYLSPASRSEPLSEADLDAFLKTAVTSKPRECVAAGWFVRAVGDAWSHHDLVASLRTVLLDGPASLAARMTPVREEHRGFAARLHAAWAVLTGR